MLVGDPPFKGSSIEEVLKKHVDLDPPDVREHAPHVPETMAELIRESMSKDPARRPRAETFAAALQSELAEALAIEQSGASAAASASPSASMSRQTDRAAASRGASPDETGRTSAGQWAWIAVLAVLAAVVAIGGGVWRLMAPGAASSPTVELDAMTNSIGMRLVELPLGSFGMGSKTSEPGRNSDERHFTVELTKPIAMGATEVTQGQWAAVMGDDYSPPEGVHPNEASGKRFLGDELPAYASWFEAAEFCRLLSEREGRLYRLPTEAEWEYACRAGTTTPFNTGAALNPSQANIDADLDDAAGKGPMNRPQAVASFPPNPWGLYDMHGNVMEWCLDWKAPYELGPLTDPAGPPDGDVRVIRGGSWDGYARMARSANRWANYPVLRTDYIGFRVVLDLEGEAPTGAASLLVDQPDPAPRAVVRLPEVGAPVAGPPVDDGLPAYEPETILHRRLRSVGSDTMDRLLLLWERAFKRWHDGVVFRHEGRGSGTAVPALAEGFAHLGPMSRPLKTAEVRAFQTEYGYEPTQVAVAIDALALYIHPDNPFASRGMSLAELDAVFSTTRRRGFPRPVRTWGDLGLTGAWASAPITVYGRNPASGTYGVFKRIAMDGGEYKPTNIEVVGSAEVVERVAADRHGIGYSGIGYARPGVVAVAVGEGDAPPAKPTPATAYSGAYPLTRNLYLTVDHPPDADLPPLQREFLRFVYSREGQRLVVQAGFFPVSAELAAGELERVGVEFAPRAE